jgi:hypothetical protein
MRLAELSAGLPSAYRLAGLGFVVYMLGVIATQAQSFLGKRVGRRIRKLTTGARDLIPYSPKRMKKPARRLRTLLYRLAEVTNIEPGSVRGPVMDALSGVYARAGAPGSASLTVPTNELFERLETTSVQLGEAAPTQAQEYDRLVSEAEFRGGVAVPLGVLLGIFAWQVWPPLVAAAFLAASALGWQAHVLRLRAKERLAISVHLGYTKIPMMEALYNELVRRKPTGRASEGTWAGITTVALDRVGELEMASYSLHEFLSGEPTESDIEDCGHYLAEQGPEYAELLDRLTKRQAPTRADAEGAA